MSDKADYLISLIGENPLPAFLTILKNCDLNTKVFLVHTMPSLYNIGTKNVADNLALVLKEKIKNIKIILKECDKSDIRAIDDTIDEIFSYVSNDLNSKTPNINQYGLVLDYSSGTKAMSVIFCNRVLNKHIEDLNTVISYLDDNDESIIENTKNNIINFRYSIKEILKTIDIEIEDIIRIHGYYFETIPYVKKCVTKGGSKLQYICSDKRIVLNKIHNSKSSISVDSLALLDAKLIIYCQSDYKKEKKDMYKKELFKIKDIAEKLGGSRSWFVYKCDCSADNVKELKKDINRAYEYEMRDRFYVLKENDSFINYINKTIEYF